MDSWRGRADDGSGRGARGRCRSARCAPRPIVGAAAGARHAGACARLNLSWSASAGVPGRRVPAGHRARIRPFLGGAPAGLQGAALLGGLRQAAVEARRRRRPAPSTCWPPSRWAATSSCSTSARGRWRRPSCARAFTRRPHWQRILVLLAGPAFNIRLCGPGAGRHASGSAASPRCGPWSATVRADSPAAARRPARRRRDLAVNGEPVAGQRDVVLGLLDGMHRQRARRCCGVRGAGRAGARGHAATWPIRPSGGA